MTKLNLVTGANGHLGNNLVRALLKNGETVRTSVRNTKNTAPFEGLDCEIVQADLMGKDSLLRALEGVDILYQVAAVFKHWARDPQKEIIEPKVKIPYRPPRWVLMTTAGLMELVGKITGKEPRMMRNQVELYYGVELHMNISKARQELGFTPRDPETAIRETFEYLAKRSKK